MFLLVLLLRFLLKEKIATKEVYSKGKDSKLVIYDGAKLFIILVLNYILESSLNQQFYII